MLRRIDGPKRPREPSVVALARSTQDLRKRRRAPASRETGVAPARVRTLETEAVGGRKERSDRRALAHGAEKKNEHGMTFLERRAVTKANETDYKRRFRVLMAWACATGLATVSPPQMDHALSSWTNE